MRQAQAPHAGVFAERAAPERRGSEAVPASTPFKAEFLSPDAALRHVDDWRALADRAAEPNPFFRPEFLLPAIRALSPGAVELVFLRDRTGTLAAAAPVTRRRIGFGVAGRCRSVWGHDYGPLSTPLVDADAVDAGIAGLVAALGGGAAVGFPNQNLDGPVAKAMLRGSFGSGPRPEIVGRYRRAALASGLASADYRREALSKSRRKTLRWCENKLAAIGAVSVDLAVARDDVVAAFEEFARLEAAGWKGANGTALASRDGLLSFARHAAVGLAEAGKLRIFALRVDGTAIAMVVALVDGAGAFAWKTAFDENHARFSPGMLVLQALTDGFLDDPLVDHVDSLATADHPLADRLWRERRSIGTILMPGRGGDAAFRLTVADARAYLRVRQAAAAGFHALKRRLFGSR